MIKLTRRKRSAKREYPHKFVVFTTKQGRTEPGIYERPVTFSGDIAFVHPDHDRLVADMVPRLCIFNNKDDAHRYFAKDGE